MSSINKPPQVSVIVPNRDHGRFLRMRLESIKNQTFRDFEVIFLDDGSKDDSIEIYREFLSDARFQDPIINESPSGCAFKQWNKGAALSRGKYIWIAESDDSASPLFLEILSGIMESDPSLGIVHCRPLVIDEKGGVIGPYGKYGAFPEPERWNRPHSNFGRDEVKRYFIFGNPIPNASGALLRRSVFEKAGGAPEDMELCGDWVLYASMLSTSNVSYVPEMMNYFRKHPASVRARISFEKEFSEHMRSAAASGKHAHDDLLKLAAKRHASWFLSRIPKLSESETERSIEALVAHSGRLLPYMTRAILEDAVRNRRSLGWFGVRLARKIGGGQ